MATQRPLVLVGGRLKQLALGDRTPGGVTLSATAPTSPGEGDEWFDTTSGIQYTFVGTGWVAPANGPATPPATMPDGTTPMSWLGGKLTRVDYPDGSYLLLTWAGSVLASTALHRAGTVKTTTLTWLSGVLQSTTTSTV